MAVPARGASFTVYQPGFVITARGLKWSLGATGGGGGRRRHGRAAVVALTGAGAGAGRRSSPGRRLGPSTP